jgi:hypothetical protein
VVHVRQPLTGVADRDETSLPNHVCGAVRLLGPHCSSGDMGYVDTGNPCCVMFIASRHSGLERVITYRCKSGGKFEVQCMTFQRQIDASEMP